MSDIEFRIYDPIATAFRFSGGTPSMLSMFFNAWATLETVHGQSWERFIGMRDKNGQGIYEGDTRNWNGSIHIMKYLPEHARFMWTNRVDENTVFVYPPSNEDEVIGNIHETPELAK